MELDIYYNLRKWLETDYAICFLDTFLCIADQTQTSPERRYKDFWKALKNHFSLFEFAQSHNTKVNPFVGVSLNERDSSNCCNIYSLEFRVIFQNSSPSDCQDGCGKCIGNGPEDILDFYSSVKQAIKNMFSRVIIDANGNNIYTNLFEDLMRNPIIMGEESGEPVYGEWNRPIIMKRYSIYNSDLQVNEDGLYSFIVDVEIEICNKSC